LYLADLPCKIALSLSGNVPLPKLLPAAGKDEFTETPDFSSRIAAIPSLFGRLTSHNLASRIHHPRGW
jgi:hypothetical protein